MPYCRQNVIFSKKWSILKFKDLLPSSCILLQDCCPRRPHSRLCRSVLCLQRMVSQRISCTQTSGEPWKVLSLSICPAPLYVEKKIYLTPQHNHFIMTCTPYETNGNIYRKDTQNQKSQVTPPIILAAFTEALHVSTHFSKPIVMPVNMHTHPYSLACIHTMVVCQ